MWALSGAGRKSQAVQTAAELVRRHLEEADGDSLESIVDAGIMHAEALFEIERADRALEILERIRARIAEVDDSGIHGAAARLESEIADALRQLRRHEEASAALAAAAEALEPPADEESVRALGWIASDTARVQGDLGRVDEAIATLAAFVERFADDESERVAERCADARQHMGYWKAVKSTRSLERVGAFARPSASPARRSPTASTRRGLIWRTRWTTRAATSTSWSTRCVKRWRWTATAAHRLRSGSAS